LVLDDFFSPQADDLRRSNSQEIPASTIAALLAILKTDPGA
jgi:hypothetical protein